MPLSCTVRTSANIALVKYWGKRDSDLILPLNDSVALNIDALNADTTIVASSEFLADSVEVNGKKYDCGENTRFYRVFEAVRKLLESRESSASSRPHFEVVSTTNFPVASGLASSAAGFAAIAYGMKTLFGFSQDEASRLARLGSGSAVRSLDGGLVRWHRGTRADGIDSVAEQLFPASHWPALRALIFVANDQEKKDGSTKGMQMTVETSSLLQERVAGVDETINSLTEAYAAKDFSKLAELVMKDSDNFHACCLDTKPPLPYLNDTSRLIIDLVHRFNSGKTPHENQEKKQPETPEAAYTFDAGPNACIYIEEVNVREFLKYAAGHLRFAPAAKAKIQEILGVDVETLPDTPLILDLIYSTVGGEPQILAHQMS